MQKNQNLTDSRNSRKIIRIASKKKDKSQQKQQVPQIPRNKLTISKNNTEVTQQSYEHIHIYNNNNNNQNYNDNDNHNDNHNKNENHEQDQQKDKQNIDQKLDQDQFNYQQEQQEEECGQYQEGFFMGGDNCGGEHRPFYMETSRKVCRIWESEQGRTNQQYIREFVQRKKKKARSIWQAVKLLSQILTQSSLKKLKLLKLTS